MIRSGRGPVSVPWAITFADLALLLLCFFVMLTSFRTAPLAEAAEPHTAANAPLREPLAEMALMLRREFASDISQGWLNVAARGTSLHIEFGSSDAFESGSDSLTPRTLSLIDAMGPLLARNRAQIIVIGHTDDVPIHNGRFRDNWELSSARAVSVIRELINRHKVDPVRLEAKGYADTRPQAANDSEFNRARNRRIEIEISRAH